MSDTENARLRRELFRIQCEQLSRATDTDRSARKHRTLAMATRDRIITILADGEYRDVPLGTPSANRVIVEPVLNGEQGDGK